MLEHAASPAKPKPTEFARVAKPYVRYAVTVNWAPGFLWGPRCLYDHELLYVLNGQLSVKLGGHEFTAPADHLMLIPPRVLNTVQAGWDADYHEHLGIHFDWETQADSEDSRIMENLFSGGRYDERLFREPRQIQGWDTEVTPLLDLRGRPVMRALLTEVVNAYSDRAENKGWQMGALSKTLEQLAYEVSLIHQIQAHPHLGADAIRRAQRARELLEAPRATPLTIVEAAAAVGWGPDHLGRICRELFRQTPQRIQTAARIRRVQQLLLQPNAAIEETAKRCGFNDLSHFGATFKRETALTPRQFVHRHRHH